MKFKAKLRKIGNSLGIIIPKNVITSYKQGDEIELNVITSGHKEDNVITPKEDITPSPLPDRVRFNTQWCNKHNTYKGTCQCK